MNVLEVIDHKSFGGDDLATHYAGENEPQPGHCHDGPGHGLAIQVLSSKVYAMRSLRMRHTDLQKEQGLGVLRQCFSPPPPQSPNLPYSKGVGSPVVALPIWWAS